MKRVLIAGAIAFVAAQALAADLPAPPVPPAQAPTVYVPPQAPVYDWGGIYFGVNGGYGFGTSTWTLPTANSGSFDLDGAVAGGTLGFNYQIQQFVLGLEGDIDWSDINGTSTTATCIAALAPSGTQCGTKNTWLSTIRARAGWAADRVLFYGTGGGAVGDIQMNNGNSTLTDTKFGWSAGAGVEAAFTDNITGRLEYLYVDLGTSSCSPLCFPGVSTSQASFSTSLIRGGLDFKFR